MGKIDKDLSQPHTTLLAVRSASCRYLLSCLAAAGCNTSPCLGRERVFGTRYSQAAAPGKVTFMAHNSQVGNAAQWLQLMRELSKSVCPRSCNILLVSSGRDLAWVQVAHDLCPVAFKDEKDHYRLVIWFCTYHRMRQKANFALLRLLSPYALPTIKGKGGPCRWL